jgi:hypothetical protein
MKYACIAAASTFCRARQFNESIAVEKCPVVNMYEYGVRVSNNASLRLLAMLWWYYGASLVQELYNGRRNIRRIRHI